MCRCCMAPTKLLSSVVLAVAPGLAVAQHSVCREQVMARGTALVSQTLGSQP
jgi:hypothetical protein